MASELKCSEAAPGTKRIYGAIKKYHPHIVCFVGKVTYGLFIGLPSGKVSYRWQPDINSSKIYVMHSPNHGYASIRVKELEEMYKASK